MSSFENSSVSEYYFYSEMLVVCCFLKFYVLLPPQGEEEMDDSNFEWTCPNNRLLFPDPAFPRNFREPIRSAVDKSSPRPALQR